MRGLRLRSLRRLFSLLGDYNAADEYVIGIGNFFAAVFHVFEAQFDSFADIGERFVDGFSLGVASLERGAHGNISAIFSVGFEENFEVSDVHGINRTLLASTLPIAISISADNLTFSRFLWLL